MASAESSPFPVLPAGPSFRRPIAVSALAHVALVSLLVLQTRPADEGGSSRRAGPPGSPGPGDHTPLAVVYFRLPAEPPLASRSPNKAAPAEFQLAPTVRLDESQANPALLQTVSLGALAGTGAAQGAGGNLAHGSVSGAGGSGSSLGRREAEVFPPQARYSILPPLPKPSAVRGKTFRVHFWVDAAGRVTRVDVSPPMPDGEYREEFIRLMYQYTFTPALRADGTPVPGETVLTITL